MGKRLDKIGEFIEKNLIKSLLIYTVLVATSIGLAIKFLVADSKIEAKQSTLEMYIAKVGVLEEEITSLKKENAKYYNWLLQENNTIPFYENKISVLENELEKLRKSNDEKKDIQQNPETNETSKINTDNYVPRVYRESKTIKTGSAYWDEETGLIFGVDYIDVNNGAIINVTLPNGETIGERITSGFNKNYMNNNKQYCFVVTSISWAYNTCTVEIKEM